MAVVKKARMEEMESKHKNEHDPYVYTQRVFVPKREGGQCAVSVYTIEPGKSAYPYHYHTKNEEVFYILRGKRAASHASGGRTRNGGGFSVFPCGGRRSSQAHKSFPDGTAHLY